MFYRGGIFRINENKRVVNVDRILYGTTDWINKL